MSQLHYMTKRGAGICRTGTAAELGERMSKLRTSAVLRSDHGAKIGAMYPCDGAYGCANCVGWHWWWDPDGDDVRPDADEERAALAGVAR